jgi:hypothetical protein
MRILFIAFILLSFQSNAQLLSGPLVDEGRKLVSETSFVIEGFHNGWAIYELSVDREGNVLSANIEDSNIKSTPSKREIRNYLMKLKFEAKTHYPKFHNVRVKITTVKPVNSAPEKEIIID